MAGVQDTGKIERFNSDLQSDARSMHQTFPVVPHSSESEGEAVSKSLSNHHCRRSKSGKVRRSHPPPPPPPTSTHEVKQTHSRVKQSFLKVYGSLMSFVGKEDEAAESDELNGNAPPKHSKRPVSEERRSINKKVSKDEFLERFNNILLEIESKISDISAQIESEPLFEPPVVINDPVPSIETISPPIRVAPDPRPVQLPSLHIPEPVEMSPRHGHLENYAPANASATASPPPVPASQIASRIPAPKGVSFVSARSRSKTPPAPRQSSRPTTPSSQKVLPPLKSRPLTPPIAPQVEPDNANIIREIPLSVPTYKGEGNITVAPVPVQSQEKLEQEQTAVAVSQSPSSTRTSFGSSTSRLGKIAIIAAFALVLFGIAKLTAPKGPAPRPSKYTR